MSPERRAIVWLTLAAALWGLSFPVNKALGLMQLKTAPGESAQFFAGATVLARFALSALLIFGFVLARDRAWRFTRGEMIQGVGLGFFGGLGMLTQVIGLAHTEASTSAFLTQATVFFVPVAKCLIDRAPPSRREGLCCVIAVLGVSILSAFDWRALRLGQGETATLIAALLFTGQILWLERSSFRGNESARVSAVMFATIPLVCLPPMLATAQGASWSWHWLSAPPAWLFLALLVGPCTLFSFCCMNHWQPHVSATTAGLIYCLEPVFATLFALGLPSVFGDLAGVPYANEVMTRRLVTGGGLILLANALIAWPIRREPA